jgi:hypothetical protein
MQLDGKAEMVLNKARWLMIRSRRLQECLIYQVARWMGDFRICFKSDLSAY